MAANVHVFRGFWRKSALVLTFFGFLTAKSGAQIGTPPIIAVQPVGISVLKGDTLTLTTTAVSISSMRFTWLRNGLNIPTGRSTVGNIVVPLVGTVSTLTITNINASDAAAYTVTVANGVGSVTSSSAVVLVANLSLTNLLTISASGSGMSVAGFKVQLTVPAGTNYVVEASSDLSAWTPIYTNIGTGSAVTCTDAAALHLPFRYYRAHY